MNTRLILLIAAALPLVGFSSAPRRVVVTSVVPSRVCNRSYAVRIESRDTVKLSFPATGKFAVRQGKKDMFVKKGDVLAELELEDFRQRLAKAQSAAIRATASLERMKNVPRGVSKEQLSQAESDKLVADAELRIAEKALADAKIVAPFDGIIVKTDGDPGQVIPGGTPVTWLHSRAVNVKLNVPERMICQTNWQERLRNADVKVEVASCPGMLIPAQFADIDLLSTTGNQVYKAGFKFETPPGYNFYEGMAATLHMPEPAPDGRPLFDVSSDALCRTSTGEAYVWVIVRGTDGVCRVARRPVNIVWRNLDYVAVTGDIAVGDEVVTLGCAYLTDDMPVTPMQKGIF